MSAPRKAQDAAFYVEDALGDRFLFTVADASYEPAFRKHAAWWLGYVRRQHPYKDSRGNVLPTPVLPTRVVMEPR